MHFYIFKNNPYPFFYLKNELLDIKAIWYDGLSNLVKNIDSNFDVEKIFIENTIFDSVIAQLSNTSKAIRINQHVCTNKELKTLPICVVPSNDTHINSFNTLILMSAIYRLILIKEKKEGAREEAIKKLQSFEDISLFNLRKIRNKYSCLLLANDWGFHEKIICNFFQKNNLPVFCLQESIIKFNDKNKRMEWCNYPLIQGLDTINYLSRDIYFLTGNPRYEKIHMKRKNERSKIFINCNFTYNLYENFRENWLDDVINTCEELSVDYLISQHPRDNGDLSKYKNVIKSSASRVQDDISNCTIIISRFSSLLHEGLAAGKGVILYNPHNEDITQIGNVKNLIQITQGKNDLKNALMKLIQNPEDHKNYLEDYINFTFGSLDGLCSQRINSAIIGMKNYPILQIGGNISNFYEYAKYSKLILKRNLKNLKI